MKKLLTSTFTLIFAITLTLNGSAANANTTITPKTVGSFTVSNVTKMLQSLTVAPEATSGYNRDLFKHWSDFDKDCFNTRAEVLQIESSSKTTHNSSCTIQAGKWYSPYDNVNFVEGGKLDVDHVVALKEAWDSGANVWSPSTLEAFANDMGYAGSLIAVSLGSNRSKSDRDISEWLPTNKSYHCTYVAVWVSVKWRWSLAVDEKEKTAITNALKPCKNSNMVKPTR